MSGIDKDENGMTKIKQEGLEVACNPIGQVQVMNRAGTDLNIRMDLCVGHDNLFQEYSETLVTVRAVKDRILADNPPGGVFCSFWRNKLGVNPDRKEPK